jgi:hypothetical protein
MTHLPASRDLQPLVKSRARPETAVTATWRKLVAVMSNPDHITIVGICLIGLLTMLIFMMYFPDAGLLIEQAAW